MYWKWPGELHHGELHVPGVRPIIVHVILTVVKTTVSPTIKIWWICLNTSFICCDRGVNDKNALSISLILQTCMIMKYANLHVYKSENMPLEEIHSAPPYSDRV